MNAKLEDLLLERWLRKRNTGEMKWSSNNGDIPIKDMTDEHLDNAINCLMQHTDPEYLGEDMWSIINGC